ncbi:MAG: CHAP domain-containing protein [Actinomycetota bacterium]|nr:CHAP domain-containing protein [Actinomycetota bacterium]
MAKVAEAPTRQVARRRALQRRRAIRRRRLAIVATAVLLAVAIGYVLSRPGGHRAPQAAQPSAPTGPPLSPLRARIVAIAKSQVGYRTDPRNSYCNKYSAHFYAGSLTCPGTLRAEEWCADFAAWVWQRAGAKVVYQFINGDLNSSSASFYEWGVRTHTWHPVGSGYRPKPGDVAVYGLRPRALYAAHVAVVIATPHGARGPTAVNGDGDITGFSVVEIEHDEYRADVAGHGPLLSGYVSPIAA